VVQGIASCHSQLKYVCIYTHYDCTPDRRIPERTIGTGIGGISADARIDSGIGGISADAKIGTGLWPMAIGQN
jgi:hypothetical protein